MKAWKFFPFIDIKICFIDIQLIFHHNTQQINQLEYIPTQSALAVNWLDQG